ncbi:MAG: DUF3467 domain-containing protein [Methanothrix sp.]|nr:MAG: DUF3467 domain-containing protein [Methanothrix sp.]
MNAANQPRPLRFEPTGDVNPQYANLVRVSHSPLEMMLDFARLLPGEETARILHRVIMSPLGAKLLLRALSENMARYETTFGEIVIPAASTLAEQLFHPPASPPPPDEEP